jgi:hypothetical protein
VRQRIFGKPAANHHERPYISRCAPADLPLFQAYLCLRFFPEDRHCDWIVKNFRIVEKLMGRAPHRYA